MPAGVIASAHFAVESARMHEAMRALIPDTPAGIMLWLATWASLIEQIAVLAKDQEQRDTLQGIHNVLDALKRRLPPVTP